MAAAGRGRSVPSFLVFFPPSRRPSTPWRDRRPELLASPLQLAQPGARAFLLARGPCHSPGSFVRPLVSARNLKPSRAHVTCSLECFCGGVLPAARCLSDSKPSCSFDCAAQQRWRRRSQPSSRCGSLHLQTNVSVSWPFAVHSFVHPAFVGCFWITATLALVWL